MASIRPRSRATSLQRQLHRALEQAIQHQAAGRALLQTRRARTLQDHRSPGIPRGQTHPAAPACRWIRQMVITQAGRQAGRHHFSYNGRAHLGQTRHHAAAPRNQPDARPAFFRCDDGRRHRLVPESPQHAAIFSVEAAEDSADGPSHPGANDHEGMRALYAALKSLATAMPPAFHRRPAGQRRSSRLSCRHRRQSTANRAIHVIADNPPAGKTRALITLMADHPGMHMQFIATYAAWLDQLERSLTCMEHNLSAPGESRPPPGLKRKLMRHIRHWSQCPLPTKWNYLESDPQQAGEPPGSRHRYG